MSRAERPWYETLDGWESRLDGTVKTARGIRAFCPSHADADPSLDVDVRDGRVLWKCRAGCSQDEVRAAVEDGLPLPRFRRRKRVAYTPPPAVAAADPRAWLASKTSCDPEFLDTLPVSFDSGRVVYRFADLDVVKTRVAGAKEIRWSPEGAKAPVVWPLLDAMPSDAVFTEGETDAIALRALGYDAFALTKGADGAPTVAELRELRSRGLRRVFVGFDADEAGRKGESVVMARALEAGLDVASIVPPGYDPLSGRGKDWCEWRAAGGENLPDSAANDPMLDAAGLAEMVKDRPEPVIARWLHRGGVLLIVAEPKTGKTSLAFGMASASEREGEFASVRAARMGSLWLSEEGYDTFDEKVQRYGLADYRVLFRHTAAERGLTFEAAVARAATRAASESRILVIDTLSTWGGLESEADASQINAALSVVRFAVGPRRVPTIVIHQTNRSGSYRGSTEFLAQVDTMVEVSKKGAEAHGENARAIRMTSRYEGAVEPVVLVRDGATYTPAGAPRISTGSASDHRAEREARLKELLDAGLADTVAGWAKQMQVSSKTVRDYLRSVGAVELGRTGAGSGSDEKVWGLPPAEQSESTAPEAPEEAANGKSNGK